MHTERARQSPLLIAVVGLLGLAAAMGIGRFAFTPMLPLMQAQHGLSISDGGWLAGANYLGYLLGGLSLLLWPPRPARAARVGLLAVAACTLPMAFTASFESWWLLRLAAGVGSAWVLVGISGWALPQLAAARRPELSGWVFAGVGLGIVAAGAVGLVIGHGGQRSAQGWLVLGVLATAAAAFGWRVLGAPADTSTPATSGDTTPADSAPGAGASSAAAAPADPLTPRLFTIPGALRITLCYGSFGFGYIIPATFLPAQARQVIADPLVFGWVWPVFGLAAATSTVLGARLFARFSARRLWAGSQLLMTAGVLLPVLRHGIPALLLAAVCVGGSFVVATMAGLQEAREIGGAQAPRLIAALTSAFALGQLIGPLAVSASARLGDPIVAPSLVAAALLLASTWALRGRPATRAAVA